MIGRHSGGPSIEGSDLLPWELLKVSEQVSDITGVELS